MDTLAKHFGVFRGNRRGDVKRNASKKSLPEGLKKLNPADK